MVTQTQKGKAFEFALLQELYQYIRFLKIPVIAIENNSYDVAKLSFNSCALQDQVLFSLAAQRAIQFLLEMEPRIIHALSQEDMLQLEIISDKKGQAGDVRDIVAIRLLQKWEIGISAKNNHRAVKHSRLSPTIDFGKKWIGVPCSKEYFQNITPVFMFLSKLKDQDKTLEWKSISHMHERIYVPLLNAFKKELFNLYYKAPQIMPQKLVEYLIGIKDFYKIIKGRDSVEIQAYNLHGSLNHSLGEIHPKIKVPRLKLPTKLLHIDYKQDSKTTIVVSFNEGWQISFRIHNASSKVEPSLKFDINLMSIPHSLFTHHIFLS